jgi:predicted AAA+ superfamily ATPase
MTYFCGGQLIGFREIGKGSKVKASINVYKAKGQHRMMLPFKFSQ